MSWDLPVKKRKERKNSIHPSHLIDTLCLHIRPISFWTREWRLFPPFHCQIVAAVSTVCLACLKFASTTGFIVQSDPAVEVGGYLMVSWIGVETILKLAAPCSLRFLSLFFFGCLFSHRLIHHVGLERLQFEVEFIRIRRRQRLADPTDSYLEAWRSDVQQVSTFPSRRRLLRSLSLSTRFVPHHWFARRPSWSSRLFSSYTGPYWSTTLRLAWTVAVPAVATNNVVLFSLSRLFVCLAPAADDEIPSISVSYWASCSQPVSYPANYPATMYVWVLRTDGPVVIGLSFSHPSLLMMMAMSKEDPIKPRGPKKESNITKKESRKQQSR